MKHTFRFLLLVALVSALPAFAHDDSKTSSSGDQTNPDVTKRLNDAAEDLNRLTSAGDNNIPQTILADAKCVAIVPSLIKGGFIVGAQHGRGVATCRIPDKGWSAPAFFTITGGSWGAQIGVEGVDLVMLFMNQEGANKLLQANWKIGADAGIAAGPFGRDASASTSWKVNSGILTYSRAKGAFIGATLNGANVRADVDSIKSFYGREVDYRTLLEGKVAPPPAARPFLTQIRQNFHEANAAK
jgi:lipid-binding SYLF domain-containing protein